MIIKIIKYKNNKKLLNKKNKKLTNKKNKKPINNKNKMLLNKKPSNKLKKIKSLKISIYLQREHKVVRQLLSGVIQKKKRKFRC